MHTWGDFTKAVFMKTQSALRIEPSAEAVGVLFWGDAHTRYVDIRRQLHVANCCADVFTLSLRQASGPLRSEDLLAASQHQSGGCFSKTQPSVCGVGEEGESPGG